MVFFAARAFFAGLSYFAALSLVAFVVRGPRYERLLRALLGTGFVPRGISGHLLMRARIRPHNLARNGGLAPSIG
jgi:hypothetical protein